jgi:hypothetical protein
MIPAEGWHHQRQQRRLTMSFPARMFVYSDRAQGITLSLTGGRRGAMPDLRLTCNGEARGRFEQTSRASTAIDLDLDQGWNELVLGSASDHPASGEEPEDSWLVETIDITARP